MPLLSRDIRVSPMVAALMSILILMLAALPALAVESLPDPARVGWAFGQPSSTIPDSYHAHFALGQELAQAGDLEGAAREYLECIRLFGPIVQAQERSGSSRDSLMAEVYYGPLATACVNLGHSLRQLGHLDTAIKLYTGAADLAPGYVSAHESLGRALVEQGGRLYARATTDHKPLGQSPRSEQELAFYRSAIAHLHVARQLEPDNASVRIGLAMALGRWGVLDAALVHARKAVELDPTSTEAQATLGGAYYALGRMTEAAGAYRDAARLASAESDEFQAEVQSNLAAALAGTGDIDGAVIAYRKATLLQPTNAVYQNNLGAALRMAGKSGESSSPLTSAAALDPGTIEHHLNLAAAYRDTGNLDAAIRAYRCALRLDCKDSKIHHQLGLALFERSTPAEAIQAFANLKEADITDEKVEGALATIAMHFMADSNLKLIDAMDPRSYEVTPRLILKPDRWAQLKRDLASQWMLLDYCPLYGEARLDLQQSILDYPNIEPALLKLVGSYEKALGVQMGGSAIVPINLPDALVRAARGDTPMAANLEALTPRVKKTVLAVALMLAQNDDLAAAVSELTWAARLDPSNPLVDNDLGVALLASGKTDKALAKFREAARVSSDIASVHYDGGLALAYKGQMSKAADAWRRAEDLKMTDPKLFVVQGLACLQATEIDYASALFKRAIEVDPKCAPAHYYLGLVEALRPSASPLTMAASEASRLNTAIGRNHYNLRAEFIKTAALSSAMNAIGKADSLDPGREQTYYYAGVELGLQDPMLSSLEGATVMHAVTQGMGLTRDWAAVTNNTAVCAALSGEWAKAEKLLRIAVADEPEYALAHWNLGRVLIKNRKEGEGRAELDIASKLARRQNLPYFFRQPAMVSTTAVPGAKLPRVAAEPWRLKTLLEAFDIPVAVL